MKQLQLGRAPECLCIHLKRTVWLSNGSLCKDNTKVSFPARLDISTVMKVQGRCVAYTHTQCRTGDHVLSAGRLQCMNSEL